MDESKSKVRVAKLIALQKIKKYYEKSNNKYTNIEEVEQLIEENKIPKEVYDDSIAELIKEKKLLKLDSDLDNTIVLHIPNYLIGQVTEDSFESGKEFSKNPVVESDPSKITQNRPYYAKLLPAYGRETKEAQEMLQNMSLGEKIERNKDLNAQFLKQLPQQQPRNMNTAKLEARHAILMIPEFGGSDGKKVFEFVEKVDNIFRVVDPNQIELLNILILNKLTNDAEQLIRNQRPGNWQDIRRILLDHFATRKSVNKRIGDLVVCIQGSKSVSKFAGELQGICTGIRHAAREENMDVEFVQNLLLKTFLDGLNREISLIVRAQKPENFQNALRLAIETEAEITPRYIKKYCSYCKRETHNTKDCRFNQKTNRTFFVNETNQVVQNNQKQNGNNFRQNVNGYTNPRNFNYKQNNYWRNNRPNYNVRYYNQRNPGNYNRFNRNNIGLRDKPRNNNYFRNENKLISKYNNYKKNYNEDISQNIDSTGGQKNRNFLEKKINKSNDESNERNSNKVNLNRVMTQTHAVVMGQVL